VKATNPFLGLTGTISISVILFITFLPLVYLHQDFEKLNQPIRIPQLFNATIGLLVGSLDYWYPVSRFNYTLKPYTDKKRRVKAFRLYPSLWLPVNYD